MHAVTRMAVMRAGYGHMVCSLHQVTQQSQHAAYYEAKGCQLLLLALARDCVLLEKQPFLQAPHVFGVRT